MLEEKQLAVGATVSLVSGGHVMTILAIEDHSVSCAWSVRGDIKTKSFPISALKKAEAEPSSLGDLIKESMKIRASSSEPAGASG